MAQLQHRRQRHLGGGGAADPGSDPQSLTFAVPDDLAGERVDKIVAVLAGISRAAAARLIEDGGVASGGRPLSARERIDAGVVIEFPPPPESTGLRPDSSVAFEVMYEDEWLAVIEKPSGVVVHPGAGNKDGTLAAGLLARWPGIRGVGDPDRWGIVHRLDRETSGLLVVAKTEAVYDSLQSAIAARAVGRRYYALVRGRLQMATGTIDAPLGRDPVRPTRVAVVPEGRSARTHYAVVSSWGERASLLDVTLETGRTHQIRVHLASIGHPVFDDRVYGGGGAESSGAGRVWLHAHRVEFDHPVTGIRIEVEAPLPPELARSLAELGRPDSSDE